MVTKSDAVPHHHACSCEHEHDKSEEAPKEGFFANVSGRQYKQVLPGALILSLLAATVCVATEVYRTYAALTPVIPATEGAAEVPAKTFNLNNVNWKNAAENTGLASFFAMEFMQTCAVFQALRGQSSTDWSKQISGLKL